MLFPRWSPARIVNALVSLARPQSVDHVEVLVVARNEPGRYGEGVVLQIADVKRGVGVFDPVRSQKRPRRSGVDA